MNVPAGMVIDVMRDHPNIDKHTLAQIIVLRQKRISTPEIESSLLEALAFLKPTDIQGSNYHVVGTLNKSINVVTFAPVPYRHLTVEAAIQERDRLKRWRQQKSFAVFSLVSLT